MQSHKTPVQFWSCRHCDGMWFPQRSFALRRRADIPPRSAEPRSTIATPERSCPQCAVAMSVETEGETTLDVCDQCGGVWLDPGEYPAALRRAARLRMKAQLPSLAPDPPGRVGRILDRLLDLFGEYYIEGGRKDESLFEFLERTRSAKRQ